MTNSETAVHEQVADISGNATQAELDALNASMAELGATDAIAKLADRVSILYYFAPQIGKTGRQSHISHPHIVAALGKLAKRMFGITVEKPADLKADMYREIVSRCILFTLKKLG